MLLDRLLDGAALLNTSSLNGTEPTLFRRIVRIRSDRTEQNHARGDKSDY